jgi:hypothetical protein
MLTRLNKRQQEQELQLLVQNQQLINRDVSREATNNFQIAQQTNEAINELRRIVERQDETIRNLSERVNNLPSIQERLFKKFPFANAITIAGMIGMLQYYIEKGLGYEWVFIGGLTHSMVCTEYHMSLFKRYLPDAAFRALTWFVTIFLVITMYSFKSLSILSVVKASGNITITMSSMTTKLLAAVGEYFSRITFNVSVGYSAPSVAKDTLNAVTWLIGGITSLISSTKDTVTGSNEPVLDKTAKFNQETVIPTILDYINKKLTNKNSPEDNVGNFVYQSLQVVATNIPSESEGVVLSLIQNKNFTENNNINLDKLFKSLSDPKSLAKSITNEIEVTLFDIKKSSNTLDDVMNNEDIYKLKEELDGILNSGLNKLENDMKTLKNDITSLVPNSFPIGGEYLKTVYNYGNLRCIDNTDMSNFGVKCKYRIDLADKLQILKKFDVDTTIELHNNLYLWYFFGANLANAVSKVFRALTKNKIREQPMIEVIQTIRTRPSQKILSRKNKNKNKRSPR